MKRIYFVALLGGLVLGGAVSADTNSASPRTMAAWPQVYTIVNGIPLHRATVVATAATPKDTTSTTGGASVTYTWLGGERVCVQTAAAAYIEVIAAASMTASGGKAFTVNASESLFANCFTLLKTQTKISVDCVSGSCAAVKFFEIH